MAFLKQLNIDVRAKRAKIKRMWTALVDKTPGGVPHSPADMFHSYFWNLPWECFYCKRPFLDYGASIHLEHAIPVSRNGSLWDFENLRLSCDSCNMIKGVLTEQEFLVLTQGNLPTFYSIFPQGKKPYWLQPGRKLWWKWKKRK